MGTPGSVTSFSRRASAVKLYQAGTLCPSLLVYPPLGSPSILGLTISSLSIWYCMSFWSLEILIMASTALSSYSAQSTRFSAYLFYLISLVISRETAGGIQYPAWQKGCDSDPLMLLYVIAWQV